MLLFGGCTHPRVDATLRTRETTKNKPKQTFFYFPVAYSRSVRIVLGNFKKKRKKGRDLGIEIGLSIMAGPCEGLKNNGFFCKR